VGWVPASASRDEAEKRDVAFTKGIVVRDEEVAVGFVEDDEDEGGFVKDGILLWDIDDKS
jgi:hypothetical protein